MIEGYDYSFSRPSPTCLWGDGGRFVGRYTGDPRKDMSHDELVRLVEAGLQVVTIYQPAGERGWMLAGFDRGRVAALEALAVAEGRCGMPEDRPIFYTLDVDPNPLAVVQWDQVRRCLDGAASVHGVERCGTYGAWLAMAKLVPDHARWGYQTSSWSGDRWHAGAQLQQYAHNVGLCGGLVDRVRAVAEDYGQWDDP